MNIHNILSTEIAYVSQFSNITRHNNYLIVKDDLQPDKYFHNYMMIFGSHVTEQQLRTYQSSLKSEGFAIFRFEESNNQTFSLLKSYQMETYGYFHAPIDSVQIKTPIPCKAEIVDPYNDEDFFQFLIQEDILYGEAYARNNAIRQKCVLKTHSDNYFYLKLTVNGEIIGDVNACLHFNIAKIDDFNIKEEFQRKGYGSALMSALIDILKQRGITDVYLVTDMDDSVKDLYVRFGFSYIGSYRQYFKSFSK